MYGSKILYYFGSIGLEFFDSLEQMRGTKFVEKLFFSCRKGCKRNQSSAVTILPAGFYLLKVRNVSEICSKLIIKRPE